MVLASMANLRFAQAGGQLLFHLMYEQTPLIASTNLPLGEGLGISGDANLTATPTIARRITARSSIRLRELALQCSS